MLLLMGFAKWITPDSEDASQGVLQPTETLKSSQA